MLKSFKPAVLPVDELYEVWINEICQFLARHKDAAILTASIIGTPSCQARLPLSGKYDPIILEGMPEANKTLIASYLASGIDVLTETETKETVLLLSTKVNMQYTVIKVGVPTRGSNFDKLALAECYSRAHSLRNMFWDAYSILNGEAFAAKESGRSLPPGHYFGKAIELKAIAPAASIPATSVVAPAKAVVVTTAGSFKAAPTRTPALSQHQPEPVETKVTKISMEGFEGKYPNEEKAMIALRTYLEKGKAYRSSVVHIKTNAGDHIRVQLMSDKVEDELVEKLKVPSDKDFAKNLLDQGKDVLTKNADGDQILLIKADDTIDMGDLTLLCDSNKPYYARLATHWANLFADIGYGCKRYSDLSSAPTEKVRETIPPPQKAVHDTGVKTDKSAQDEDDADKEYEGIDDDFWRDTPRRGSPGSTPSLKSITAAGALLTSSRAEPAAAAPLPVATASAAGAPSAPTAAR